MSARNPIQALVLSGGGANGAYEVGILKALFSGRCKPVGTVDPDYFFGTSVGAFNASFLVSQWEEYGPAAVSNLERVWLETMAGDTGSNGAFRFRGDPTYFLNPASYLPNPFRPLLEMARDSAYLSWEGLQRAVYFTTERQETVWERAANLFDFSAVVSLEPFDQTIRNTINFGAIRQSGDRRKLRIFATNWLTGQLRIFENRDMTENLGPQAIQASSAIPGVFPSVTVGAEVFVDGSVLMTTPLRPALDVGTDILHVVYLDPDVASIPLSTLDSTVAASYRLQTISWAALIEREIDRARRINRGLALFNRIREGGTTGREELDELAKGAISVLGGEHPETYRPVTIHRYHPRDELGRGPLSLLNLDRDHVDELIQRGFSDASLHNCEKEGCVLPDPELLRAEAEEQ
ncbi:MAG TPA: patatin-like phospholipase family protein [Thermoanaerobaculia bacterium]|nr:patatin-like phospholipase family protein [Thermoanaerobaculia bacterium]